MTIFGKIIMGIVLVLIGTGVFYGVSSYVKYDSEVASVQDPPQQDISTTTEEMLLLSATTTATTTEKVATTTTQGKNGKKIPFTDFISKGGSYKCTVTLTVATGTSAGVVYFHDRQVRGEFTSLSTGASVATTVVLRDGYTYSWVGVSPIKGYKTKSVSGSRSSPSTEVREWETDKVGDYSCVTWSADDSIFELPKTISFTSE